MKKSVKVYLYEGVGVYKSEVRAVKITFMEGIGVKIR